jgi:hypothetical protein
VTIGVETKATGAGRRQVSRERREAAETGEGQQPRIQDEVRRRGRRRRDSPRQTRLDGWRPGRLSRSRPDDPGCAGPGSCAFADAFVLVSRLMCTRNPPDVSS